MKEPIIELGSNKTHYSLRTNAGESGDREDFRKDDSELRPKSDDLHNVSSIDLPTKMNTHVNVSSDVSPYVCLCGEFTTQPHVCLPVLQEILNSSYCSFISVTEGVPGTLTRSVMTLSKSASVPMSVSRRQNSG